MTLDAAIFLVACLAPTATFAYVYFYSPPNAKQYRRTLEILRAEALARWDTDPFARAVYDTVTDVLEPRED